MNEPIDLAINQAAERLGRRNVGGVVAASTRASDEPVVTEAGQLIDGYGYPVEKVLFEVGSVTKVFTALLLADCVERGLVSLDAPLRELLPSNTSVPARDRTEITLGHLATHTAGLPRSPLGRAAELTRQDPYCEVDASALLGRLAGTSLRCTPGTGKPSYSNFGFALLGLSLAAVTSSTYEEAMRERVLEPLALDDTTFTPTPEQLARHAHGHRWRRRPARRWHLDAMNAAGGLHSTAADLLRFLDHQLRPGGTSFSTAITMTHRSPLDGLPLAWQRLPRAPSTLWHNGATGGYRAFVAIRPSTLTCVVILLSSFTIRGADLAGLTLLRQLD